MTLNQALLAGYDKVRKEEWPTEAYLQISPGSEIFYLHFWKDKSKSRKMRTCQFNLDTDQWVVYEDTQRSPKQELLGKLSRELKSAQEREETLKTYLLNAQEKVRKIQEKIREEESE